jgi:hypothetical protein
MTMLWPRKLLQGSPRDWSLGYLYEKRASFLRDPEMAMAMVYPGQEMLMGHVLPPFQRPSVWTREQNVRFIESAVLGLHLGTWVYNSADHAPTVKVGGRDVFDRTDMWLIDGRQRLTAFDEYFGDAFQVFGMKWSEVPKPEQRRLLNGTLFTAFETRITDVGHLKELYDRLNFGGTPHQPDQRAVADGRQSLPVSDPDEVPRAPGPR